MLVAWPWLTVENISKKQAVAELLVTTCQNFVNGNMGEKYAYFAPLSGTVQLFRAVQPVQPGGALSRHQ